MQYFLTKGFEKQLKKLSKKLQGKTIEKLIMFTQDPFNHRLNNHPLKGEWLGFRSVSIAFNLRAVYKEINKNTVRFVALGSHSELYE